MDDYDDYGKIQGLHNFLIIPDRVMYCWIDDSRELY